mgnify:CR=1 FL=1
MKYLKKSLYTTILLTSITFSMTTNIFANDIQPVVTNNQSIISHSETWVTPQKNIEVTVYDLGDGFTATETVTSEYKLEKASGIKKQTSTTEIKNKSEVAATITVFGEFSYDGKSARVIDCSYSKSIKSGYSEISWSTNKRDSSILYGDAIVNASLNVKNNSTGKSYVGLCMVTCGKNG